MPRPSPRVRLVSWLFAASVGVTLTCDGRSAAQQIIQVPAQAATLATALAMAQDGDVIQISGGWWPGVPSGGAVVDKSVTIEAAPGQQPRIVYGVHDIGLRIAGLGANARVFVRNLTFGVDAVLPGPTARPHVLVDVGAAAGRVVFDGVRMGQGHDAVQGRTALEVRGSANLSLVVRDAILRGESGNPPYLSGNEIGAPGGHGLVCQGAVHALVERSLLLGGEGGHALYDGMGMRQARPGGAAVLAPVARLGLVGCVLRDGDGGFAYGDPLQLPPDPCSFQGTPGGSVHAAACYEVHYTPAVAGGATGCPPPPPPQQQQLGASIDLLVPVTQPVYGAPLAVDVRPLPPAEGWSALVLGGRLRWSQLPGLLGPLWLDGIVYQSLLPPPPATGLVTWQLPVLPPGIPFELDLYLQLVHVTHQLTITTGNPASMTLLPVGR